MTYSAASPVFAKGTVTVADFRSALSQHASPALSEAAAMFAALDSAGVDPAVFLGQFSAESSYGTKGYAQTTRSPGNIVISLPLVPHWTRAFGGRPWKASNGRTYAAFSTWRDGTRAYAALMRGYKLRGWATSIAVMASRWLGMKDASRSGYVANIVSGANAAVSSVPTPKPAPDPDVNPYEKGSVEYVLFEHEHGRSVPPKTPPPAVTPPPAPKPVIPLTPTLVPALVSNTTPQAGTQVMMGGLAGLRFGTSGPVFVLVHGGPFPVGIEHVAAELGWRLAARGTRTFAIDYRSDTWQNAVADVEAAIADARALANGPLTVVAHSFGGLPASIAVLRDGAAEAYVAVNAISSAVGVGGIQAVGVPDPVVLAKLRPTVPVSVVRGQLDNVSSADDKAGFLAALNAAGHPGLNILGPGDHTGTLYTDATLDAIVATANLI